MCALRSERSLVFVTKSSFSRMGESALSADPSKLSDWSGVATGKTRLCLVSVPHNIAEPSYGQNARK